jgi:hypothetical protein
MFNTCLKYCLKQFWLKHCNPVTWSPDVQKQIQVTRMWLEKSDTDFCSIVSKVSQSEMKSEAADCSAIYYFPAAKSRNKVKSQTSMFLSITLLSHAWFLHIMRF